MIDLDVPEVYDRFDPAGMRERIRELPRECLRSWQQSLSFNLPPDYCDVDKVVILGMGGSAIGGDLLASLKSKVPILVNREYDLPSFVDGDTLVIASSYSGMTEETLSSFTQALYMKARKLVLTTGGSLKSLAEQKGVPVYVIDYAAPPRAALAHSFIPLLGVCCKLGILADMSAEVAGMVEVLGELLDAIGERQPLDSNPAKKLATRLYNRLAVIYGAGFLSQVARRWKTQINENSKAWAFYELFPELNHNAVVGYEFPAELAHELFVILLHSRYLHQRNQLRYKVTSEVLSREGVSYEVVEGRGEDSLSQMMSLVFFGDWVSYYLALLYETDPSPVKVIDYLKGRLAES
ncbi:bifunctional phosphoglucose/phosphomannose isomerase [Chloroflexota bacterium]